MRIAVTVNESSLDADIDPRFGRCPYFLIVETDDLAFEAEENPNVSLGSGAGIQCAQRMAEKGVEVVLTGNCGPNAHQALSAAGIEVVAGCSGAVRRVIEQFKEGQRSPAGEPNAIGHFATRNPSDPDKAVSSGQPALTATGRGLGRGGGRGPGRRGGMGRGRERSSFPSGTDTCGVPSTLTEPKQGAGTTSSRAAGRGYGRTDAGDSGTTPRIGRRRVVRDAESANPPGVSATGNLTLGDLLRWTTMPLSHAPKILGNSSDRGSAARRIGDTVPSSSRGMLRTVAGELKIHAPFTIVGALTGIAIMVILSSAAMPRSFSTTLFWGLHPLHVLLSALVTAGMYRLHSTGKLWATILIGYLGSVGIATLSDCIIPYIGETLLGLPNKGLHVGFIEKWWLVHPFAATGIAMAYLWPKTQCPHAGHVLLSTWASLFHMTMAAEGELSFPTMIAIFVFLFLAVWIPCCTSDIVFPLLFSDERGRGRS